MNHRIPGAGAGFLLILCTTLVTLTGGTTVRAALAGDEQLVAIDVLLEPDQVMVDKANEANARRRADFQAGYALDAIHAPHITLLQRFVRTADLAAVTAALAEVFAAGQVTDLSLQATGYEYAVWGGSAVTAVVVDRTDELMRLHRRVLEAVRPYAVNGGTAAAFCGTGINPETIGWVEGFVPNSSGSNYAPHVTVGVANEAFVKQMKAEPFEAFTFHAAGAAVYQLGNFGTAAKVLWRDRAEEPLASWNDTGARRAIVAFVESVTTPGSPGFVAPADRIATFDNDGTLWAEQPLYFQMFFAIDRVKELAPQHPEWTNQEPFASVLKGDLQSALAGGEPALIEMIMATHAGLTTTEFEAIVNDWVATARHPQTGRLYTEMVYQPMLELLAYLRGNGFRTYIVSGGGIEFIRPWAERVYGIPPEQVIGSRIRTRYEFRDGQPVLVRLPEVDFVDDKEGKPVGIHSHLGRRPLAAFGNSDGDLQMLQWTAAGDGARFCLYLHHDDAAREWAYDRVSDIGRLDKGLDEALTRGWTVVSMKNDWRVIYPPAPE